MLGGLTEVVDELQDVGDVCAACLGEVGGGCWALPETSLAKLPMFAPWRLLLYCLSILLPMTLSPLMLSPEPY